MLDNSKPGLFVPEQSEHKEISFRRDTVSPTTEDQITKFRSIRVDSATSVHTATATTPRPNAILSAEAHRVQLKHTGPQPGSLPTPVNSQKLKQFLEGYDPHEVDFIISGFTKGFKLHYEGPRVGRESPNLKSALQNPELVRRKINKEVHEGRMAGPFNSPPIENLIISPLGLQPKKSGDFRLIQHLSYPRKGNTMSVNAGTPREFCTVSYEGLDQAVEIVKKAGRGCFMGKLDVRHAFRNLPLAPSQYQLVGIKWENNYYYDMALPMGASSSCQSYERFATALQWGAKAKLYIEFLTHILDDYFSAAITKEGCDRNLSLLIDKFEELGIPIAHEKTFWGAQTQIFAGIEIDSVTFELRLPLEKLKTCLLGLLDFISRKKIKLRELQSLLGLLNFACLVIKGGRAFLRRLYDLTIGLSHPLHRRRITADAKADALVWINFLQVFNGRSLIQNEIWEESDKLNLFTDASKTIGYGITFKTHWAYGTWSSKIKNRNIDIKVLELYPIVLALSLWGSEIQNRCIVFNTDNETIMHVINKQTSKDPTIMQLVRPLVLACLKNNIQFRANFIPGIENGPCDCLSRLKLSEFQSITQDLGMDPKPTQIQHHLDLENWLTKSKT